MQLYEDDICQVTRTIWSTMLGWEIRRTPLDEAAIASLKERTLSGCVQITGAWEGDVALHCSDSLARKIAALTFGIETDEATLAHARDALGEMANMTGGNVKSLLPAPSSLSLPAVVEGTDYSMRIPVGRLLAQIAFECQGERVLLRLVERDS
ncbi:MAG: chemotaxis protein CheX [Planctomycetes bacterium]|nr:chemotaxis protein CheX [Planctomycetota bacterium]